VKKCPYCAEEIQDAAVVCKHCGRDLKGGASQVQLVQPKKRTSLVAWGCLIFLVVIVGLCVAARSSLDTAREAARRPPASATGTTSLPPAPPSSRPSRPPAPTSRSGNPAHDALMAQSAAARAIMLAATVRSSGDSCTGTRAFFQGLSSTREAIWNVACSNGKAYGITVQPDPTGSTKVLDCAVLKALGSDCFKKF
jgi:hypothetical protein